METLKSKKVMQVISGKSSRPDWLLALDADNIPVRDPEYLFECNGYREIVLKLESRWPELKILPSVEKDRQINDWIDLGGNPSFCLCAPFNLAL